MENNYEQWLPYPNEQYRRSYDRCNDLWSWKVSDSSRNTVADTLDCKTVYRSQERKKSSSVDYDKETRQRKIDSILDKISKSGYDSLSKAEKDFLFKAGKEE